MIQIIHVATLLAQGIAKLFRGAGGYNERRDGLLGAPRSATPQVPQPRSRRPQPQQPANTLLPGLPPSVQAELAALIASRQMIAAIKLVRTQTGLGLKEAKDLVDGMGR